MITVFGSAVRIDRSRMAALIATFAFGMMLSAAATAEEIPPVSAVQSDAVKAFGTAGKLSDARLEAVSGLGADPSAGSAMAGSGELSVILFDELGRPKQKEASADNGANSTVMRSINGRVGR
jgi:hypothetical protein